MAAAEDDDARGVAYKVVINDEEQYSIWPAHRTAPTGWHEVGVRGSKQECLAHVEKVWTDITPLSVRASSPAAREP
jgi:MbtH protein